MNNIKINIVRVIIQRVNSASVSINTKVKSEIADGLLVFVGIEGADTENDIEWLCNKIVHLRIFNDENGVMNLSVLDVAGSIMVISQFTLYAKTRKGNRPSYIRSAGPDFAIPIYNKFIDRLSFLMGKETFSGEFGSMMKIKLENDGPVTIIIDTKEKE